MKRTGKLFALFLLFLVVVTPRTLPLVGLQPAALRQIATRNKLFPAFVTTPRALILDHIPCRRHKVGAGTRTGYGCTTRMPLNHH